MSNLDTAGINTQADTDKSASIISNNLIIMKVLFIFTKIVDSFFDFDANTIMFFAVQVNNSIVPDPVVIVVLNIISYLSN